MTTPIPPYGTPKPKKKKSPLWLIIGGVVLLLLLLGIINSVGSSKDTQQTAASSSTTPTSSHASGTRASRASATQQNPAGSGSALPGTSQGEDQGDQDQERANQGSSTGVSREYANALRSAQNYVDTMPFSRAELYDQLTSEYGGQFPADAAQYAVDNVNADWNAEALESAENYQEIMPMSDAELLNQLTSEYGDQFTQEQAQYAIDHLPR